MRECTCEWEKHPMKWERLAPVVRCDYCGGARPMHLAPEDIVIDSSAISTEPAKKLLEQ